MTTPVPPAAAPADLDPRTRRRRVRRRALIAAPLGVAVLALAALGAAWRVERDRLAAVLDGAEASAARAGVVLRLPGRRVDGFPFRLRVTSGPVRLSTASGWAVEAPEIVAQAFTYAPLHWVLIAPAGLTVVRPQGGPVSVSGAALRASVSGVAGRPWRVVLAGEDLRFATPPGARPFSLAAAQRLGVYLKPAPGAAGDGAILLDVRGARPVRGSVAWNLAPDAPIDGAVEGRLTRLSAFSGPDWGTSVRRWRDAGGALALGHVEAQGGATELWARGGALAVGADGRLTGAAPLRLRQAPVLISGPPGAQTLAVQPLDPARRETDSSAIDLVVRGGEVRLGPVRIADAPKVG